MGEFDSARGGRARTATSSEVSTWRPSPPDRSTSRSSASARAVGPLGLEPAVDQCPHRVGVERLESEQCRTAPQRWVDLEERILRRRADQRERAVLDRRQQRVLLRLAEAVDLVEEQDRALAALAEPLTGTFDHLAHVLDAGGHRRELLERACRRSRRPRAPRSSCRSRVGPRRSPTSGGPVRRGAATVGPGRPGGPDRRRRRACAAADVQPAARSLAAAPRPRRVNRSATEHLPVRLLAELDDPIDQFVRARIHVQSLNSLPSGTGVDRRRRSVRRRTNGAPDRAARPDASAPATGRRSSRRTRRRVRPGVRRARSPRRVHARPPRSASRRSRSRPGAAATRRAGPCARTPASRPSSRRTAATTPTRRCGFVMRTTIVLSGRGRAADRERRRTCGSRDAICWNQRVADTVSPARS